MKAWYEPTEDGRWPVPHTSEWPDDIRETVRMASQGATLLADLTRVFQTNEEMLTLSRTYHWRVKLEMHISSSRKYTHYKFPHCPKLRIDLLDVLRKHGLQFKVDEYRCQDELHLSVSTVRIGAINETITYGAEAWHCPPMKN